MPLLKTWTEENGRWGIWQVTETLEELYACLSDDVVRQELERLKAPSRKMEYLAVRVLLKTMLGKEVRIGHEPSGKPFLTGGEYHVSISHTKGYVAVGLHESAQPGIDLEAYGGWGGEGAARPRARGTSPSGSGRPSAGWATAARTPASAGTPAPCLPASTARARTSPWA